MSENHLVTIDDTAGAGMKTTVVKRSLDDDDGCIRAPAKKLRCDDEKHITDNTVSEETKMSQAEHLEALQGRFSLLKEALKTMLKSPECKLLRSDSIIYIRASILLTQHTSGPFHRCIQSASTRPRRTSSCTN